MVAEAFARAHRASLFAVVCPRYSSVGVWAVFGTLILDCRPLHGQTPEAERRDASVGTVVLANGVLGGVIASTHAALNGRNPLRAAGLGTLGGLVHGLGKLAGAQGTSLGLLTNTLSSTGTSMVSNAAAGGPIWGEFVLPVGGFRLRLSPTAGWKPRVTVNVYESVLIGQAFFRKDLRFDAARSLGVGTFVFNARAPLRIDGVRSAGGTKGSRILISDEAVIPSQSVKHEAVHVQQYWFMQETLDTPIERHLRRQTRQLDWIPEWLEFGLVTPAILTLEDAMSRNGPIRRLREGEAEALDRQ